MAILVLAANTAYADFPRLASILARDRFLPRQFMNQGDRLAFSNGILILSVLASVLLVLFGGDTHALIPLYMIGVFVSFTLSQAGMVLHWRSLRGPGWKTSAAINGFGAIVTGIVLLIVATTKAAEGAWIIIVMIPVLVTIFEITRRHYDHVAAELTLRGWRPAPQGQHVVLVPIGGLQRAVVKALRYARTLSDDVRAVYVEIDPAGTEPIRKLWPEWGQNVDLVVLESPYRSLMEPFLEYIEQVQREDPHGYVTVILPGVRASPYLAAPAAQSARAADQGRAVVQAERRRHECAVPSRDVRRRPPARSPEEKSRWSMSLRNLPDCIATAILRNLGATKSITGRRA